MERRPAKWSNVVLYGLAAGIWLLNGILTWIHPVSLGILVLNTACGVLWSAAFARELFRYLRDRRK